MYSIKKSEVVLVLALAVALAITAFLFNFSDGLTGADVLNVGVDMNVNSSENLGFLETNIPENITPDLEGVVNESSKSTSETICSNETFNTEENCNENSSFSEGHFFTEPMLNVNVPSIGISNSGNGSQCGGINTSITLSTHIVASQTCFNINASSITINCNGFSINYSTSGLGGYAINDSNGFDGITIQNCVLREVNSSTSDQYGIYLLNSNGTYLINNTIITNGSNAHGVYLTGNTSNTTLFNNNISSIGGFEIMDDTDDNLLNYVIFNNSFGKLEWLNNGSGGFLHNLTLNVSANYGFGLNGVIFIGNNTLAVNTSAFFPTRINFSANITLYNISLSRVDAIKQLYFYETSNANILSTGVNCSACGLNGFTSRYPSWTGEATSRLHTYQNDWNFNTTSLGSFTLSGIIGCRTAQNNVNITLDSDVSVVRDRYFQDNGACIYIATPNVVIDCQGHKITGNGTAGRGNMVVENNMNYGIIAEQGSLNEEIANVTIKNCVVQGFFANSNNALGSGAGIKQNVVVKNPIGFLITNNTIYNVSIGIDAGNNVNISNNVVYNASLGIFSGYSSTIISGNRVYSSDSGIIIDSSATIQNNILTGNRVALTTDRPIGTGLIAFSSASGTTLSNNSIQNNTIGYGICSMQGNTIRNDNISNNSYAFMMNCSNTAQTYRLEVQDVKLSGNTNDLFVSSFGTKFNFTFINTTVNKSKMTLPSNAYVFVLWYADVNITNITKTFVLSSATVDVMDSTGHVFFSNTTIANGISRVWVMEYYRTNNVNYFVTPTTIKAHKNNYLANSTIIDFTNHTATPASVNLSLGLFSCSGIITTDLYIGQNTKCSGDGIIVGANNITIFGNKFNLIGLTRGMGIGINVTGFSNISVVNMQIKNFSTGLYLEKVNNSYFFLLKVNNNSRGIILNASQNNLFYDINSSNNTEDLIAYSDFLTNNSLVNFTTDFVRNTVGGNTTVFRRWYVDVNVTYNGNQTLVGGTVVGVVNQTNLPDDSSTTNNNGIARLELLELLLNSTGTYTLAPHNISISFSYLNTASYNETSLNISNNSYIQLNIPLNCTTPNLFGQVITSDTTFCPGTYSYNGRSIGSLNASVIVQNNNINIHCINTVLTGTDTNNNPLIDIINRTNISISGCTLTSSSGSEILLNDANDIRLENLSTTASSGYYDVYCENSTPIILRNISSSGTGFELLGCPNIIIEKNIFSGSVGLTIDQMAHGIIRNNSFQGVGTGIKLYNNLYGGQYTTNNTFYFNNFSSVSSNYIENYIEDTSLSNFFNTTVNDLTQGNVWSDYCDKGSDSNNDSYADLASSTGGDWPQNKTVSTKILVSNSGINVIDYGPRIISCPPINVQLGSSSSSSSSGGSSIASSISASIVPPPAPQGSSTPPPPPPLPPPQTASASEARDTLLTQTSQTQTAEKTIRVTVSLENTGTKTMKLFPELLQQFDDPFFIVKTKTLGFEGSLFSKLASLSYSKNAIAGRLMKATILNADEITIPPGQKVDQILEIEEGLHIPRHITIQFKTFGEVVKEQQVEVEKQAISGTALDVDSQNHLIDLYAVIVPGQVSEKLTQYKTGLTGAAVASIPSDTEYQLEFAINKKNPFPSFPVDVPTRFLLGRKAGALILRPASSFSDLYGPYHLRGNQTFVLAQQLRYNPLIYHGDYEVTTKIYRGDQPVVENKFEVELG